MNTEGLRRKIEFAINATSAETGSNTPDFVLAEYLIDCLAAFDKAVTARSRWYNVPAESDAIPQEVAELNNSEVAQSAEQRPHKPQGAGSRPALATTQQDQT